MQKQHTDESSDNTDRRLHFGKKQPQQQTDYPQPEEEQHTDYQKETKGQTTTYLYHQKQETMSELPPPVEEQQQAALLQHDPNAIGEIQEHHGVAAEDTAHLNEIVDAGISQVTHELGAEVSHEVVVGEEGNVEASNVEAANVEAEVAAAAAAAVSASAETAEDTSALIAEGE